MQHKIACPSNEEFLRIFEIAQSQAVAERNETIVISGNLQMRWGNLYWGSPDEVGTPVYSLYWALGAHGAEETKRRVSDFVDSINLQAMEQGGEAQ